MNTFSLVQEEKPVAANRNDAYKQVTIMEPGKDEDDSSDDSDFDESDDSDSMSTDSGSDEEVISTFEWDKYFFLNGNFTKTL